MVRPAFYGHRKYHNKQLFYVLSKELQRRTNIHKIDQLHLCASSLYAPVTTVTVWYYHFNHHDHIHAQLPNSPRTPGWRKMTSEDIHRALALVNKYSSQFELRQVFTSEEFSHHFLCPAVPNYMFIYMVENETSNITDLVT